MFLAPALGAHGAVRPTELGYEVRCHVKVGEVAGSLYEGLGLCLGSGLLGGHVGLDRVLFICFAEDTRSLLPPNLLKDTAEVAKRSRSRSDTRLWDELRELFRDIDEGRHDVAPPIPAFNGGLFAKDVLLDEKLLLSDGLASELVSFARYDYREMVNVEVLGHVFEQSISDLETLHKVYSIDPDATESDPIKTHEARREMGVFYTPGWVTEYLVDATIGRVAQEKGFSLGSLSGITILDPACGSGAFLAQAFRYLVQLGKAAEREGLPLEQETLSALHGLMGRSALMGGLRGVDIMPEAVEIARLSLWLASATPDERLNVLDGIQVGNTLLSPSEGEPLPWLFPDVMDGGGFDVVVGNPPWGAKLDYPIDLTMEMAHGQFDSYELFVEKSIAGALAEGGLFGFVIPDRLLRPEGERLRRWLFDAFQVLEVIKLGEGVFSDVARASVLLVVRKSPPSETDKIRTLTVLKSDRVLLEESGSTYLHGLVAARGGYVTRSRIVSDDSYEIPLGATDEDFVIMEQMRSNQLAWIGADGIFGEYGRGVETGTEGWLVRCNACFEWQVGPRRSSKARGGTLEDKVCAYCSAVMRAGKYSDTANIISESRYEQASLPGDGWRRILFGEDVSRYSLGEGRWIRTGVPNVDYKDESLFAPGKLLIRQAGVAVNAAVDETDAMCLQSVYVYRLREDSGLSPYYVLACLASRAMLFFFHRLTNQSEWQSFPKLVHKTLQRLPIPDPHLDSKNGRALQDEIHRLAKARMGKLASESNDLDLEIENLVMSAYQLKTTQRQRVVQALQSAQRLRVIREMFPADPAFEDRLHL